MKDILEDEEQRKVLHARFLESQKYAQIDPWKAAAEGENAHEFQTIKVTG